MSARETKKQNAKAKRALVLSGGGARGAYQIGVWKRLCELKWEPDIICGTSVGSINAVGIGSGMTPRELEDLWLTIEADSIFRLSLWTKIKNFILRRPFRALMDTTPLRSLLAATVDWDRLNGSQKRIFIAAVNVLSSELRIFENGEMGVEHVMASSAIPLVFPPALVNGEPHWDGGMVANTPLLPALQAGAKEIVVILLSPVGSQRRLPPPRTRQDILERAFEQSLSGSYQNLAAYLGSAARESRWQEVWKAVTGQTFQCGTSRIITVAPGDMLGFKSILNFSARQADALLSAGYRDAIAQLGELS